MLKNCKTLKQVVQSLFDHYHSVGEKSSNVRAVLSNNSIIIMNAKTGKQTIARCRKGDTYDYATGVAIAWAKYTHKNPRWEEKTALKNLKVGERFTVTTLTKTYSFILSDFSDNYAYCRLIPSDQNGLTSEYKRFHISLIVTADRYLY